MVLLLLDAYALHQAYVQRMGNALDYYPFWAGGRQVLLHQRNPYSPDVMRNIQVAIYGRPALPGENQHGYAYPAYSPLIVAPFLALPFSISAALWIAVQQVLLVASIALVVRATGWSLRPWHLALLCLAAMTYRYAMIAFVLGQTSTWVFFCLSLALWAATRQRAGLAGLALAGGLIKPQLILLPALALLVTLQPARRLRLILSLGGTAAVLLVGSWLLAGVWLGDYWRLLQDYQGYSTTQFPVLALAQVWLPNGVGRVLNLAAIGGLLVPYAAVLWRARGSGQVALPLAMAVVVTQLLVPQTGSYNLTLLVLPAVVALERLNRVQIRHCRLAIAGRVLVWTSLVILPWLLLPVVKGRDEIPLDVVVLPLLVLLVLLGSLWLEKQRPDAREALDGKVGVA